MMILLLVAVPLGAAQDIVTEDPSGDEFGETFGSPGHEPAVDILRIEANVSDDRVAIRMVLNGTVPIAQQANQSDPDRRFTYLFILAIDPASNDLYGHIEGGGDAVVVVCDFHQGQSDLGCEITMGTGGVVARGAFQNEVTTTVRMDTSRTMQLAGGAQLSVPNGTDDEPDRRRIVNQDFTDNALPYEATGRDSSGGFVSAPQESRPWWQSPIAIVAALLVAVTAVALWQMRRAD